MKPGNSLAIANYPTCHELVRFRKKAKKKLILKTAVRSDDNTYYDNLYYQGHDTHRRLRAFERGRVGSAVRGMSGCHRTAAFPGDLAFDRGHTNSQVSATTAFGERWIEHGAVQRVIARRPKIYENHQYDSVR